MSLNTHCLRSLPSDILDVQVDIKTDKPLVFDFRILSDHQNIFLLDQMLDCIRHLSGLLCRPLHRGPHSVGSGQLLDNFVDNLALSSRFLALVFEIPQALHHECRDSLELVEGDLDLLFFRLSRLLQFSAHLLLTLPLSVKLEEIIIDELRVVRLPVRSRFLLFDTACGHLIIERILHFLEFYITLDDVDIGSFE